MKKTMITCLFMAVIFDAIAATLHVGNGQTFANLTSAAAVAQPSDTILLHAGTYPGGLTITNLKGLPDQWISIKNAPGETVIFDGGSNAIQFVEPAFLHVFGLIFQHQTGNGVNTDDGGTYDTPAHHVVFEKCTFRDMSASGNNDLLKLSGLDHFEIRYCTFLNGAAGGSGIDMVGCHHGIIAGNHFENLGSNSIQCKGGSEQVRIERNFFKNGGQRAVNLGGSTGLQFFRPDTAHFEAARLQVFSNIFIGSEAPVAFVGSVEVDVANNTIYLPGKWVARILQETVDTTRFLKCGSNLFRNNLIFLNNNVSTATNIGPNTAPETFIYSNNLWFHANNPNWGGPYLPVIEINQILNADPLFNNPSGEDFSIPQNSPAAAAGLSLFDPKLDFFQNKFANPRSIGAIEANPVSDVETFFETQDGSIKVFPNPALGAFWVEFDQDFAENPMLELFDLLGRRVAFLKTAGSPRVYFPIPELANGSYFLKISAAGKMMDGRLVVVKN